jgi:glycosyltransferase involved in cell wall biosynthesis
MWRRQASAVVRGAVEVLGMTGIRITANSDTLPAVSVVMPCYNAAATLPATLDSLLAQTLAEWELIAVDDGSTDATAEVIRGYQDARMVFLRQENRGPAAARNRGIAAARCDLVALLDADDLALPHRLETQRAALLADPALALVAHGFEWVDEAGRLLPWPYHAWRRHPDLNDLRGWLFDCPVVPSAVMLRKDAWRRVGGFDERLIGPEDWDFWLRLALAGERMAWGEGVVCHYRRAAQSLSGGVSGMASQAPEALRRVLARPDFPAALRHDGQRALALRYVDLARRQYAARQFGSGAETLTRALGLDPTLAQGAPSRIEDDWVAMATDPLVADPLDLLHAMLEHLPGALAPLRRHEAVLLARAHLELARCSGLRRHMGPLLRLAPRLLPDPAWWAFVRRWARNRVREKTSGNRDTSAGTADVSQG